MDRISHAAEGIDTRGDIVGNDPVAAFPRSFCLSFFNHGPGLGGEADDQGGAAVTHLAETC